MLVVMLHQINLSAEHLAPRPPPCSYMPMHAEWLHGLADAVVFAIHNMILACSFYYYQKKYREA
jgi:hypothetical protein